MRESASRTADSYALSAAERHTAARLLLIGLTEDVTIEQQRIALRLSSPSRPLVVGAHPASRQHRSGSNIPRAYYAYTPPFFPITEENLFRSMRYGVACGSEGGEADEVKSPEKRLHGRRTRAVSCCYGVGGPRQRKGAGFPVWKTAFTRINTVLQFFLKIHQLFFPRPVPHPATAVFPNTRSPRPCTRTSLLEAAEGFACLHSHVDSGYV